MKRNISQTKEQLENRPETNRVEIDGDTSGVIFRALVDDVTDDLEAFIEERGAEIERKTFIGGPFGVEVEFR